jgi:hypothetical protein
MKTHRLLVCLSAGVAVASLAWPASAETTTASVTITGGALAITVPATAGSLGTRQNSVGGGTISGSLGQVQVSDARSAPANSTWVASAISTALTPNSGPTIAAAAIGYTAGVITKTGTATYVANDPLAIDGVFVAGGTVAGTYAGTITHSVV